MNIRPIISGLLMGIIQGFLVLEPAAAGEVANAVQPALPPNEAQTTSVLRIGISPGTWQGLNRNDTTAAIGAWAKSILKQKGLRLLIVTRLFDTEQALVAALKDGTVDCTSMGSDQFFELDPELQADEVYLAVKNNSVGDRFVLLARGDSGIGKVSDLRGRKLLYQSTARTTLCLPWLDTMFAANSLRSPKEEMSEISPADKPSKAVLSVFFQQSDVCLVTSNAFTTAAELNPQLQRAIRVVAVSEEFVSTIFFFRKGCDPILRDQLDSAILTLHENPAGQQVMNVFQCDRMIRCPVTSLHTCKELLSRRNQLRGGVPDPKATASASTAKQM